MIPSALLSSIRISRRLINRVTTRALPVRMRSWVNQRIKRGTQLLLKQLSHRLPNPGRTPNPKDINQILVFGDMGIGNFVMLTPLLRALRRYFTEAEIVVLFLKSRGADLVASRLDTVDRVVFIPEGRHPSLRKAHAVLRAARALGLSPQLLVGRFNGSPFLPQLATGLNVPWRVGHISSAGFKAFCDEVFNYPVRMRPEQHEVERNLDLARALNIPIDHCDVEFPITEGDVAEALSVLERHALSPGNFICLQMGSSEIQKWKRWPAASWAALIAKLATSNCQMVLLGSEDERALSEQITQASGMAKATTNLCGTLSLGATAVVLKMGQLLICNDSGLMHIASAVKTPIIGLFGPTEVNRTRPWTERFVALYRPCPCNVGTLFDRATLKRIEACERPCLTSTTADDVLREVEKILEEPRGNSYDGQ